MAGSWHRRDRHGLCRCSVTIFDISVPIHADLPVYPGDPAIELSLWAEIARGDPADITRLAMGVHTGTHVDAPAHFLPDGLTVDAIDLAACVGPAEVIDVTEAGFGPIEASLLAERLPGRCTRVLLKTQNSTLWSLPTPASRFASLTPAAARLLVERNILLVGIDYLSVAPAEDPATVHRELLLAGIVIVEGLDLSRVAAGTYILVCLPLHLKGAEGAPARAVLISDVARSS
jgi:arylformamidase